MLLPSALSCESRQNPTRSQFTPASRLFPSTPPPSEESFVAGNSLLGTCRALQSLLNVSPASSPRHAKPERLQSPLQFRPHPLTRSQKVVKPAARPPRGANKRRRESYEDENDAEWARRMAGDGFTTPKRRRRTPLDVPFGLETADFQSLDTPEDLQSAPQRPRSLRRSPRHDKNNQKTNNSEEASPQQDTTEMEESTPADPNEDWTSEDDRRLVELVLDKLRLSKQDWDECARKMGKDQDSVGRRWKALVGEGNVGLRRGRRLVRGRIDESWMT